MNSTITKRADELKRGDLITNFFGATTLRCPAVVVHDYSCGTVRLHDAIGSVGTIMLGYDSTVEVEVEAPALSPAQQHAERMIPYLRDYKMLCEHDARMSDEKKMPEARAVLERRARELAEILEAIDPPAPPTLEEALDALQAAHDYLDVRGMGHTKVESILDRAKRAGVLKP